MNSPLSIGFSLVIAAVVFRVSAQVLMKLRLNHHGAIPWRPAEVLGYLTSAIADRKLILGLVLLVAGSFFWFAALSRLPLSYAFPVSSLSYPLILAGSMIFLKEHVTPRMICGNLLILAGIIMVGVSR